MSTIIQLAENSPAHDFKALLDTAKKTPEERKAAKEEKAKVKAADQPKEEKKAIKEAFSEPKPEKKEAPKDVWGTQRRPVAAEPKEAPKKEEPKKETEPAAPVKKEKAVDVKPPNTVALLDEFFSNVDQVFTLSPAETEATFTLAFKYIAEVEAKRQVSYVTKLISALSDKPAEHTTFKLETLISIFNSDLLESLPEQRLAALVAVVKVAVDAGQAQELAAADLVRQIDVWTSEWRLEVSKLAELYLLVANLCGAAALSTEHFAFLLKYLRALEKAPAAALDAAKPHALTAVRMAVAAPNAGHCDVLLNMAAVKAMGADAKYANDFQLLRIFATEHVEAYAKFYAEHKDFVDSIGLNHEDNLKKMRTLTLSTLPENERLSYSSIREKLQLADNSEVEACVIDAVVAGRLDAKLDQQNETVVFRTTSTRSFDSGSWKHLASKLSLWQKNVASVLSSLQAVQSRTRAEAEDLADV